MIASQPWLNKHKPKKIKEDIKRRRIMEMRPKNNFDRYK